MHVDEIDANNAAHVAQLQHASNFFGRLNVGGKGIRLLAVSSFTVSAIDINNVHRFGVLNDEIATTRKWNLLAKKCFDLLVNAKALKYGYTVIVISDDFFAAWGNFSNVILHLDGHCFVIYMDICKITIEQIAQNGIRGIKFSEYAFWGLCPFQICVKSAPFFE